jgi:hypothetical protein
MKTLKYLTICFVVCCLFAGSLFAVPNDVGISISIRAEFQGTDVLAFVAEEGDVIEYIVTVSLSDVQFPITDGEPELTLPDGTVIDLDNGLALGTDSSIEYPPVPYTIDSADLGQQPGASANEVRGLASVEATSQTGSTTQDVAASTNFDTVVIAPCVSVDKTAECDVAQVGDIFDYTITISNCGDDPLTAVSIMDVPLFGDLLPACDTLAPGADCIITLPYTVLPGDPDPLLNEVTVVYEVTGIPAVQVTDTNDFEVDIIHPDFTVVKECLTDDVDADEVTFLITITNTGDVPLDFTTDEGEIAPFTLVPGEVLAVQVTQPVPADATEVENTVNVIATLPEEYICADNGTTIEKDAEATCNILQPDFTVTKECITPEVLAGEMATFLITITNTGQTSLDFVTDEAEIAPFTLAVGEERIEEVDRLAVEGSVSNTINVTATTVNGTVLQSSASDTCGVITPDFEVVKNCLTDPVVADSNALFEIIITNTGDVPLIFDVNDAPDAPFQVGPIDPGANWTDTVQRVPGDCGVDAVVSNTVVVTALYGDAQELGPKEATAECPVPCVGDEGCTPGFWKNHPDCWCDSYTPTMDADDVFTALQDPNYASYSDKKCDFDTDSLLDALKYGGGRGLAGSVRNMLRHATAALLNGCSDNVQYPVSDALVIDLVNAALATEDVDVIQELHGVLAGFNEDNPCPINAHCQLEDDDDEASID